MNENIAKLLNLVIALIFFTIAIFMMTNIDSNLKSIIKVRRNKNYQPSELSLKYTGNNPTELNSETKNTMLIANLVLEKSRNEAEDVIINTFGETVNLNNKNDNLIEVVDNKNVEIKAILLKDILLDNSKISVNFMYNNLDLAKVEIAQ